MVPQVFGGMKVRELPNKDALAAAFFKAMTPRAYFDKQGKEHERIDLQLFEKIERLLVPKLGQWEQSNRWWHQTDCDGNGTRQLMFSRSVFEVAFLSQLRNLLVHEHANFGILCSVYPDLGSKSSEPPEFMAGVTAHELMVAGNTDHWFRRAA